MILSACGLTSGALLSGGSGKDVLVLPPGLSEADLTPAGARLKARRAALAESEDVSGKTLASLDDHVARLQAQVRDLRGRR